MEPMKVDLLVCLADIATSLGISAKLVVTVIGGVLLQVQNPLHSTATCPTTTLRDTFFLWMGVCQFDA